MNRPVDDPLAKRVRRPETLPYHRSTGPRSGPRTPADRAAEAEIAAQLTARRRALQRVNHGKFTLESVGRRAGVVGGAVYNWEAGVCYPVSFDQWVRWANAVGMRLSFELDTPE